ncbi:MAG: hypothetical protein WBZ39_06695 [Methylovirgula sp.]
MASETQKPLVARSRHSRVVSNLRLGATGVLYRQASDLPSVGLTTLKKKNDAPGNRFSAATFSVGYAGET